MTKARCANHKDNATFPGGCSICVRIQMEARIVKKTVKALLDAGYLLAINDGESLRPGIPTDMATEILAEMMETDDELLTVYQKNTGDDPNFKHEFGWVRFVYGNDGWDVMNDYTTNLETVLTPVNEYADRMGG